MFVALTIGPNGHCAHQSKQKSEQKYQMSVFRGLSDD